ncbi:MAG: PaaI family thioesterase [Bacillota bacterium]|nr:PaaI family thioesterase [Bacillota bacterium]
MTREGLARIRYVVEPRFCNPRGTLQGGMFAVYVDEAMGYAVLSLLGGEARFATTDLVVHYLRPVVPGEDGTATVIAEARVIRLGRSTAYLEGEVRDADGEVCARASSTVMLLS